MAASRRTYVVVFQWFHSSSSIFNDVSSNINHCILLLTFLAGSFNCLRPPRTPKRRAIVSDVRNDFSLADGNAWQHQHISLISFKPDIPQEHVHMQKTSPRGFPNILQTSADDSIYLVETQTFIRKPHQHLVRQNFADQSHILDEPRQEHLLPGKVIYAY
jgi:hypothetical protein